MNQYSGKIREIYKDHAEFPYISPDRDLNEWIRGYRLTEKGRAALDAHPEIIDRHPKKGG